MWQCILWYSLISAAHFINLKTKKFDLVEKTRLQIWSNKYKNKWPYADDQAHEQNKI